MSGSASCWDGSVSSGGAWALSQVLTSFLFGVSAHDPETFILVPLVLLVATAAATLILALVSLAASWLPARLAARVHPAAVLRSE
jgi:ABC-type lipoprotein release transport system permease subunit